MMRRSDRPLADGFHLSTYLTEPGLPFLLSTWTRHDNNVSLWLKDGVDVRLVHYWELERHTGIKHHGFGTSGRDQARALLDRLLSTYGLSTADIGECWGTPGISASDVDASRFYADVALPFHSIAHLHSAAFLDGVPQDDRTVLGFAVDGAPDFDSDVRLLDNWYAGGVFRAEGVEFFPVESPGPMYNVAAGRYGMEEGTLMALATASPVDADVSDLLTEVMRSVRFGGRAAFTDGSSILDEVEALVRRRVAGTTPTAAAGFDAELHVVSAVMKQVQRLSVAVMERNVETAAARWDLDLRATDLALAGGYALNCPTNSHLMRRYGFRRLLAPPCVNDGGQSLGIALATIAARIDGFRFQFPGAYLGDDVSGLEAALVGFGSHVVAVEDVDMDRAVHDIRAAPVAWVNGRAELGPRALGNRSLLADPTQAASKDRLNRVKGRQPWRPVAPIVLESAFGDWFEDARPSPYMLETFSATPGAREAAPAILHLDGTARVQTVDRDQNPALHALLTAFNAATGVPILCNTSLNDKGEPIVQTPAEALNFCLRKGVEVAYIAGRRVQLDGTGFAARRPAIRPLAGLAEPGAESGLAARHNPHGLADLYVQIWLRVPEIKSVYDPTRAADLPALRDRADAWLRANSWDRSWYESALPAHQRYLDELDDAGFAFGAARRWRALRSE